MVKIRLSRGGSKKNPFYHLTVTDSRNRRDGNYIERIGYYNPMAKGDDVPLRIDLARVDYWLGKGAQPSDRVASLLKRRQKEDSSNAKETAPEVSAAAVNDASPDEPAEVKEAPPAA